MKAGQAKNFRVLIGLGAVVAVMVGLVAYAPTLYQLFCAATGYGGTVQRAAAAKPSQTSDATVSVSFDANVAPGLDWEFRPEQRKVETRFGEPTKVYYYARNRSDETVVARATFNVTPYKAAPYFFKIECFCFTEERLGPGESARMPLVLYVDGQMRKDLDTEEVRDITLSYTFFNLTDLSPEEVEVARDLDAGSEALDATLKSGTTATFDNDAPRQ